MSQKQTLYIVGHPISHSKSPAMYNAVYAKLGLDWHYDFMDIDDTSRALEFMKRGDYLSINITTPYKPEAYEAADIKAASALLARGVNLIVKKDNHRLGYNVDGTGCVDFLEHEEVDFKDKKVVVCGTGPTSLAIVHACAQAGAAEVIMLGRNKDRAQRVLNEYIEEYRHLVSTAISLPSPTDGHLGFAEAYDNVEYRFGSYTTSTKAIKSADIIIDATVLGMSEGDPAPFDTTLLSAKQVVMDTVYGHGETAIIKAARKAGCRAFDGAGMLVAQAVATVIIICEVEDVDVELSRDDLFDIMKVQVGL